MQQVVKEIAECLITRGASLAVAESCTGGYVGKLITDFPGSSAWFQGGVICYSNDLKCKIGVEKNTIDTFGAVSLEVVEQLAEKICTFAGCSVGLAISGVAGPEGGTQYNPVGTVCFSWYVFGKTLSEKSTFQGERNEIRHQAAIKSLVRLHNLLQER